MTAFIGLHRQGLPPRVKPYEYKPLGQYRETRFITLLPSDQKDDGVFGEFIHSAIAEDDGVSHVFQYEALSYHWGSSAFTETIYVREKSHTSSGPAPVWFSLMVTSELHSALLALRREKGKRVMWIDAICIDQMNQDEKATQIPLMGAIYSQARQVPIWLGGEKSTPPAVIRRCIDSCRELCRYIKLESELSPDDDPVDRLITAVSIYSRGSYETTPAQQWAALMQLFNRPWFRRIWIIQEAVRARQAVFMWGSQTVEWDTLQTVASALKIVNFYMILPAEGVITSIASLIVVNSFKGKPSLDDLEFPNQRARNIAHFSMFLFNTRRFLTSKPHDKIYGILGLLPADRSVQITPNYRHSPDELYWEISLMLINNGFYGIIGNVWWEKDPSKSKLPSWVVDFRQENSPQDLLYKLKAFSASKVSITNHRLSVDRKKLLIHGKIIDRVAVVGNEFLPTPDGSNGEFEADNIIMASHANMAISTGQCFNIFYANVVCPDPEIDTDLQEEDWNLFSRILTCDIHAGGEKLTEEEKVIAAREFKAFMAYHSPELPNLWYNLKEPSPEFTRAFYDAGYFAGRVRQWVKGRAFIASEQRRAGWAPPSTRPGDVICLLFGFSVPFILRPVAGNPNGETTGGSVQQYYLIGECYLHGVMDGEAMMDESIEEAELMII